jgi:hypothetical protein
MTDSIIITTDTITNIISSDINTSSIIVSATQGPPGAPWDLQEGGFDSDRVVITSLGSQVLDSFPYTQYGAAKYIIYATLGIERQICEILLIQDGTIVQTVEYANMVTSSLLGTFSASITEGFINIIVEPVVVGTSFKIIRTLIKD